MRETSNEVEIMPQPSAALAKANHFSSFASPLKVWTPILVMVMPASLNCLMTSGKTESLSKSIWMRQTSQ